MVPPAALVFERADLEAALRRALLSRRPVFFLAVCCVLFVLMGLIIGTPSMWVTVLFLLGVCSTVPFWVPLLSAWRRARGPLWPSGPTTWEVADEGLVLRNDLGTSTFRWSTFRRAETSGPGVTLWRGNAIVFVPNRAFRDPEHLQAFVAASEGLIAVHRP